MGEPTLFPTEQHTIEQTTAPSQTLSTNYVSLVVILTGVSESNKDDICSVLAKAIGGIVTLCFLESPSRRTLQEKANEVNLYMEINVEDAATARLQVESNGFLESLEFPEGITAESLVLSSTLSPSSSPTGSPSTTSATTASVDTTRQP